MLGGDDRGGLYDDDEVEQVGNDATEDVDRVDHRIDDVALALDVDDELAIEDDDSMRGSSWREKPRLFTDGGGEKMMTWHLLSTPMMSWPMKMMI